MTNGAQLYESILLVVLMVSFIVLNLLILVVIIATQCVGNVNKLFMACLTILDLLTGIAILPFSVAAAFHKRWPFDDHLCEMQSYVLVIFGLMQMFLILVLNCDHYAALRWPTRYPFMFSRVRSICWIIIFTVTAFAICIPPIVSHIKVVYISRTHVCSLNVVDEQGYYISMGGLVFIPITWGIIYTSSFKCSKKYRQKVQEQVEFTYDTDVKYSGRPAYFTMNCIACLIMIFTWLPWVLLQAIDLARNYPASTPRAAHFHTFWLTQSNAAFRAILYLLYLPDFRRGIINLVRSCSSKLNFCDKRGPIGDIALTEHSPTNLYPTA